MHVPTLLSYYSHIRLYVTPWTVACQAPLSMGILQQEYWSGLPCPPPGDFPHPGIESGSPAWQAESLPLSHRSSPTKCTPRTNLGKSEHSQWVAWMLIFGCDTQLLVLQDSNVGGIDDTQACSVFFLNCKWLHDHLKLKVYFKDCTGGPVVKTVFSYCRGHRFDPWSGN